MKTLKTLTLLFMFALTLVSCQDDDVTYDVTEEMTPYVDRFFEAAADRGVTIKRNNLVVRTLPKNHNNVIGGEIDSNGQKIILVNPIVFTSPEHQALFAHFEITIYSVLTSLTQNNAGRVNTMAPELGEISGSALTDEQREIIFDQLFSQN